MAKVHPNPSKNTSDHSSSGRETFTIWMKSLVFHGNGCTIFNSKGEVAFRVDNYQQRCSKKVFLMDSIGQILFSLNRKKLGIFGCWEGFKWIDSEVRMERAWFKVRRNQTILSKDRCCQVTLGCDENSRSYYKIIGLEGKSAFKITDFSGQILAENLNTGSDLDPLLCTAAAMVFCCAQQRIQFDRATQKQSSEGVSLGDDVLTLMVEPHADQSLIMALVTVYGLINNKL